MTQGHSDAHNRSLLLVAGHAIYIEGRWYGGFPGEEPFYARHVQAGFQLFHQEGYHRLVFSGGPNRPHLESETRGISEAEGMKAYAIDAGLCGAEDARIILEPWSRDSMENLLFSILAYAQNTGQWPARVGVVSWSSKGLRFHLIAAGMRLGGRIHFHGVGDYATQTDLERACAAEARFNAAIVDTSHAPPSYRLVDPLLRNENEFARKRWGRMPRKFTPDHAGTRHYLEQIKLAYCANNPAAQRLLDQIESLTPGDGWKGISWPWLNL